MRKIIFISFISCLLLSCSGEKETSVKQITPSDTALLHQNIKAYLNNVAHDPSSYQPVSSTLYDTITWKEHCEFQLTSTTLSVRKDSLRVKELLFAGVTDTSMYMDYLRDDLKWMAKDQQKLDSVLKTENPDRVYGYRFYHNCRLKNKMGALTLTKYYIETNDTLKVIKIQDLD